jgi:presenilin-like A22 family membrane protease
VLRDDFSERINRVIRGFAVHSQSPEFKDPRIYMCVCVCVYVCVFCAFIYTYYKKKPVFKLVFYIYTYIYISTSFFPHLIWPLIPLTATVNILICFSYVSRCVIWYIKHNFWSADKRNILLILGKQTFILSSVEPFKEIRWKRNSYFPSEKNVFRIMTTPHFLQRDFWPQKILQCWNICYIP